jgi:hypothetical protein
MKERSSMKHEAIDRFTQHPHKITQHAQRMRKVWKKATGAGGVIAWVITSGWPGVSDIFLDQRAREKASFLNAE